MEIRSLRARAHEDGKQGGRRRRGRGGLPLLAGLSFAVASAGLMLPADAAVNDPHTVFVLKNDSIVEVEGLADGENVRVEVRRDGVLVGSSEGPAANPGGTFMINHDFCWDNFTPEILPGDVVTVTTAAGVDTVPVTNIHVTQGPTLAGNSFTIRGTVTPRVPAGQLMAEARGDTPQGEVFRPLAPNLNPDAGEVRGQITYDGPTGGAFTATYTGLNADQVAAVPNLGEFFVAHVAATSAGGDPKEMTMATEGSPVPGPGCSLDAPVVRHAVTDLSLPVINRRTMDRNLRVSGMTLNSTAVQVRLRDRDGTVVTRNVTPAPATGAQTWGATFTPTQMRRLNGRINVAGSYTSAGATLRGATMSVTKDIVAPKRPHASPDGGTYRRRQAVSLGAQAGSQIRYTLGTRQPAPRLRTGSVYRGRQIRITSTQTLKAIAVDKAGNVSQVTSERYVIRR